MASTDYELATGNWSAIENNQGKGGVRLLVTGTVERPFKGAPPTLTEAKSHLPKVLALDLNVPEGLDGSEKVMMSASFAKIVKANQYEAVVIRWKGTPVSECRVLDDAQTARHFAALTAAENLRWG
jgi:hypothetical protein